MKKFIWGALIALSALANTACSNQWRESDPGVEADYAFALFEDIAANNNTASLQGASFDDIRGDMTSTMYFSESGEAMGPAASVFSFIDTSFLGQQFGPDVFQLGVSYAGIIFFDNVVNGQRVFTLMIRLESLLGTTYYVAQSQPNVYKLEDKDFEVRVHSQFGSLLLRSHDTDDEYSDELAGTIHLKAYMEDAMGEYAVGQFSVLHGFGGAY